MASGDYRTNQIDDFIKEVGDAEKYTGITKKHWIPPSLSQKCSNKDCGKSFTFTIRKHHCRKCGEIFCQTCVGYERRLNTLAKPDPNARLYKVCKACFDQGPQTLGFAKSWTHVLKLYRARSDVTAQSGPLTRHKVRLNYEKEWQRLKEGFKQSLSTSSVKRAFNDLKSVLAVPDWQKSPLALQSARAARCCLCMREFTLTRSKSQCVVCGAAVCSTCSTKDMLVYLPDGTDLATSEPQLCIIKIVGCPAKEPELSLYLRACVSCHQTLEDLQVTQYKRSLQRSAEAEPADTWSQIDSWNSKFRDFEKKVEEQLPVYQDLVDLLENGLTESNSVPKSKSYTQTLAKAQCDLSDHLSKYVVQIFTFKQLTPTTPGQTSVYKNIIRSKCEFYQENMFLFREAKKRLAESTPQEVLVAIQRTVDQNAINSCSLTVKQLALEVLHLCTKYAVHQNLPQKLALLDQVVEQELRETLQCSTDQRDSWDSHTSCAHLLIKDRLTKGQKFIRPSRRLTARIGAAHIDDIITERCDIIVKQVLVQLESKSAHKSFSRSKELLGDLQKNLDVNQG